MLSPNPILINRAIKIIPEYSAVSRRSKHPLLSELILVIVPIMLVAAAYFIGPFMPVKPAELSSINLGIFIFAVTLSRLCGRSGTWVAATCAILAIAWIAPPADSMAVDAAAWPWFVSVVVMIAAIAMTAPRAPIRRLPLRWRKAAHPSRKMNKKAQRGFVVDDRVTIPLPR